MKTIVRDGILSLLRLSVGIQWLCISNFKLCCTLLHFPQPIMHSSAERRSSCWNGKKKIRSESPHKKVASISGNGRILQRTSDPAVYPNITKRTPYSFGLTVRFAPRKAFWSYARRIVHLYNNLRRLHFTQGAVISFGTNADAVRAIADEVANVGVKVAHGTQ